jgi:hypothetical protein
MHLAKNIILRWLLRLWQLVLTLDQAAACKRLDGTAAGAAALNSRDEQGDPEADVVEGYFADKVGTQHSSLPALRCLSNVPLHHENTPATTQTAMARTRSCLSTACATQLMQTWACKHTGTVITVMALAWYLCSYQQFAVTITAVVLLLVLNLLLVPAAGQHLHCWH